MRFVQTPFGEFSRKDIHLGTRRGNNEGSIYQRKDGRWEARAFAVAALRRHRTRQREARLLAGSRWQDTGCVITTSIGTPIDASNLSRKFHTMLSDAKLPRLRWHELRHSAASLMFAQGTSIQEVQAMMGHSQISVTMDYYAHLMPGALKGVADRMDAAFATGTADA